MKKLTLLIGAALWSAAVHCSAQITGFGDLNFWGTGANRSALVIDWNNGHSTETLAWGFYWNGPAPTVFSMMQFLAANDPRFFMRIDSATGFGPAIFGLGYQWGSSPFGVSGAVDTSGNPVTPVFTSGVNDLDTNPSSTQAPTTSAGAVASNAGDFYKEGWMDNGYWEFFTGTVGASYPSSWTSSFSGVGGTFLNNDGWYALSITEPDFSSNTPGPAYAAIPEPSALFLLIVAGGGGLLLNARRRIHTA